MNASPKRPKAPTPTTLEEALREAYRTKWSKTKRSASTTLSQAEAAVKALSEDPSTAYVSAITQEIIQEVTAAWYDEGLAPSTINKRLNALCAMGVSVEGCRFKVPKRLQWWLRPDVEQKVCAWLEEDDSGQPWELARFATFIRWTTRTGLRIEESLSLRWTDFSADFSEVTVPGTKTANSQATLALSTAASSVLLHGATREIGDGPWPWTYEEVHGMWRLVRNKFRFVDPTATLKALRRSAARHLHVDCGMPLDMVRQYLRHDDVKTTMGYLRLTGGYSLEEQRRYLK